MSTTFYISLSISITFASMIFGFLVTERIKGKDFYQRFIHLDLIKDERINRWIWHWGDEVFGFQKFLGKTQCQPYLN